MSRRTRAELARRLGTTGAAAGLLAGLVQALAGSRIPAWSGAKADPVALGVLTVALSTAALSGALGLHPTLTIRRRAAVATLLLLPAGLCASTVGRLWVLPGTLLLAAGLLVVAGGRRSAWAGFLRASWSAGLLSVLACCELLMAVSAVPTATALAGAAALLVLVAAWTPLARRPRLLLVALGALPFAALTWWSLVTPLVAVLAMAVAAAAPSPPTGTVTLRRPQTVPG